MRTTIRRPVTLRRTLFAPVKNAPATLVNAEETTMKVEKATISLGPPITAPCLIPVLHASTPTCINEPFMVGGKPYPVTALSFGSPHGAVFVDDVDSIDVEMLGSAIGTHDLFPEGASVVFVQVLGREGVIARLWQRGKGESPFTCEAACVAGTAAMMLQKVLSNEVNVFMGGHSYQVKWARGGDGVSISAFA